MRTSKPLRLSSGQLKSFEQTLSEAKAKAFTRSRAEIQSEGLAEFVARVSPELSYKHLQPLIDVFDRAERGPVRVAISVPPQHGKSTLCFYWIAKMMFAARPLIYLTYSADFASSQMRRARRIAESASVPFRRDSRSLREWESATGASLWADGISGSVTGRDGSGIILVDDAHKSWAEAQSFTIRERIKDDFKANVMTRAHENTSIIAINTRWHTDDISAWLESIGWEVVNLPAIDALGNALWPEQRGLAFLELQRKELTDIIFSALYQGRPRPVGTTVFKEPCFYETAPVAGYQLAIGVDLAYTSKTSSDYSVAVVMARLGDTYFVLDVVRKQCQAPDFMDEIRRLKTRYVNAPARAYVAGTEKGTLDFFSRAGVHINAHDALNDKFLRAQPLSAAWNDGRVLLPRYGADGWLDTVTRELLSFTGAKDAHDDIVDAMAAAFDELERRPTDPNRIDVLRRRTSAGLGRYY